MAIAPNDSRGIEGTSRDGDGLGEGVYPRSLLQAIGPVESIAAVAPAIVHIIEIVTTILR